MTLLTKQLREALPPLGSTEEQGLDALAVVKFFTPDGGWTWFASEFDGDDIFFGYVAGIVPEFGTFRLSEIAGIRGALGLPVERDRFFRPTPLRELVERYGR